MQFGHRRVVDHVSLEVHRGEIVRLLGPNGVGKTVTFSMLVVLCIRRTGRFCSTAATSPICRSTGVRGEAWAICPRHARSSAD
jgi:ABC-type lipopolysaccharide export system ATPase subunit